MPKPYLAKNGIHAYELVIESVGAPLGKDFLLENLSFRHAPGEHASLLVMLKISADDCRKYVEKVTINDKIKLSIDGENGKQLLFIGHVVTAKSRNMSDFNFLEIEAFDASVMEDLKKSCQSFQNKSKKYQDILGQVFKNSTVKLKDSYNDAINNMIIQLDETNWEFAKRMASRFNLPVISDVTADKSSIYLGLRDGGGEIDLTTSSLEQYVDARDFEYVSQNAWGRKQSATKEDFSGVRVTCYSYLYLGDKIKVNGKSYIVRKVFGKLIGGVLKMTYDLTTKESGFLATKAANDPITGRILIGQVKEVKQDLVRVHLLDIDDKFDSSGDTWLPYATAYSSRDGSGWYVMPEKEDYVRVLLPSSEESDAFVSSAINTAPTENVRNKSFKAPGGKEILLTDDGVEIIAEHQKIFVKLSKDKGIHLVSTKNIAVSADGNIELNAKGKIEILAGSGIDMQSGGGHLKILSDQVSMGGNTIKLGE